MEETGLHGFLNGKACPIGTLYRATLLYAGGITSTLLERAQSILCIFCYSLHCLFSTKANVDGSS